MGEAGDGHAGRFQLFGDIVRGGLAIDRRIEGEDDLLERPAGHAVDQLGDGKIVRPDPVERRKHAAEHMIAPAKRAGPLQRPEIGHILDDAERGLVAIGRGTHRAGLHRVEIPAGPALGDLGRRLAERLGQRHQQAVLALEQVQRHAPRRAGAEPRQLGDQLDHAKDFRAGDSFRHGADSRASPPECKRLWPRYLRASRTLQTQPHGERRRTLGRPSAPLGMRPRLRSG